MSSNSYTIAIRVDGQIRKITKLMFSRDGSYMITVPYHTANKGILLKLPVNYETGLGVVQSIPYSATIDAGDVEEKRVKLSHHRSGLLQFSGEGVVSGFDGNGNPRGIGVQSWTLDEPASGPSFGITFFGLHDFQISTPGDVRKLESDGILFDVLELPPALGNGFVIEGFYFAPKMRRFVKSIGGKPIMQLVHPTRQVMDLKVALADPSACDFPGLIGFTVYAHETKFGTLTSGYCIGGSSGNLRRNKKNELEGDALYCFFPDEMGPIPRRNLNHSPTATPQSSASGPTTGTKKDKT